MNNSLITFKYNSQLFFLLLYLWLIIYSSILYRNEGWRRHKSRVPTYFFYGPMGQKYSGWNSIFPSPNIYKPNFSFYINPKWRGQMLSRNVNGFSWQHAVPLKPLSPVVQLNTWKKKVGHFSSSFQEYLSHNTEWYGKLTWWHRESKHYTALSNSECRGLSPILFCTVSTINWGDWMYMFQHSSVSLFGLALVKIRG